MARLHFMEYNERLYLNINVEYYIKPVGGIKLE